MQNNGPIPTSEEEAQKLIKRLESLLAQNPKQDTQTPKTSLKKPNSLDQL